MTTIDDDESRVMFEKNDDDCKFFVLSPLLKQRVALFPMEFDVNTNEIVENIRKINWKIYQSNVEFSMKTNVCFYLSSLMKSSIKMSTKFHWFTK